MDILSVFNFSLQEVLICILLVLATYSLIHRSPLPPGPLGLPFVGYLPFLGKKPHLKLQELGKKYGDIFSIKLGSSDAVILNSAQSIREVINKPEATDRPTQSIFKYIDIQSPFFSSGDQWVEHRRFSLHVLRDLGFGKSVMHDHIVDEIEHFLKAVENHGEKPCNIVELLTPSMSNNICSLVFGKRLEYSDPERVFLDKALNIIPRFLNMVSLAVFFPWFSKLPLIHRWINLKEFLKVSKALKNFVERKIDEHKLTLDENNPRDFIDSYLLEIKAKREKEQKTTLSDAFLVGSVTNFFGAGSETVRTTISWALYAMAAYRDVQRKVQEELDRIVGPARTPTFSDAKDLPYTQSVIAEVQRWRTVAPLSLLRRVVKDVKIRGYTIPQGTVVIPNLWAAHHNPEDWDHPDEFDPERFLAPDGKTYVKSENWIPFSYGRRSCPGESLAQVEVFLYFAFILQKFQIELPKDSKPCFDGELGISYHPKPFEICLTPR